MIYLIAKIKHIMKIRVICVLFSWVFIERILL